MTVVAETKAEIPEDVKQAADAVWEELASGLIGLKDMRHVETEIIAHAILSERERCARIADARAIQYAGRAKDAGRDGDADSYTGFSHRALVSKFIASSIRSGAKP